MRLNEEKNGEACFLDVYLEENTLVMSIEPLLSFGSDLNVIQSQISTRPNVVLSRCFEGPSDEFLGSLKETSRT